MNIAARAGRWSASHWKTATFGWLAIVVVAIAIGSSVGTVTLTGSEQSTGDSARAQAMLERAGFHDHAGEIVLIQSRTGKATDPGFRREIRTVAARLGTLSQIQSLRSPLAARPLPGMREPPTSSRKPSLQPLKTPRRSTSSRSTFSVGRRSPIE